MVHCLVYFKFYASTVHSSDETDLFFFYRQKSTKGPNRTEIIQWKSGDDSDFRSHSNERITMMNKLFIFWYLPPRIFIFAWVSFIQFEKRWFYIHYIIIIYFAFLRFAFTFAFAFGFGFSSWKCFI